MYALMFYSIGNGNAIAHEDFVSGVIIEDSCDEDIIDDDVPQLTVMDLRSYTATLGNRAKGGGSECTGKLVIVQ